ncbi:hypothetical protein GE09DRAFT_1047301 [Coniochaeta sp. 2T2.1]|nr:hypothetical protein GE09DRAFT_1047301 [Coniochaeta sp. 2T2.1]
MFNAMLSSLAILGAVTATSAAVLHPRACNFAWAADSGDTCQSMASTWGISVEQFAAWNLGVNCNAPLTAGKEYCLLWDGPDPIPSTTPKPSTPATTTAPTGPSPTQSGIASDCQKYHLAVAGDTCQDIVNKYGYFSLADFYKWNPDVGNLCSGLWLGYYYCIAVKGTNTTPGPTKPSPIQDGITSKCNKWYKVSSGDACQKIADQFKITLQNFYSWNPAVGSACSSLWLGYYVCVGIS